MWYLHSGCYKHVTGDKSKFSTLILKSKGFVTYGYKNKGKIPRIGKVGMPSFTIIVDVLYVKGLKCSLLSIGQICDKCLTNHLSKDSCIIEDKITREIKLVGKRISNVFMISLDDLS